MYESVEQHLLVTRECYNEKEEVTEHNDDDDTDTDNEGVLVDASRSTSSRAPSRHQESEVGRVSEPDDNVATTSSPSSDAQVSAMVVNQPSEDFEEMEIL